jgi:hypothetical protein
MGFIGLQLEFFFAAFLLIFLTLPLFPFIVAKIHPIPLGFVFLVVLVPDFQ